MKVFIKNVVNNREWGGEFETEQEMNAWVDMQVAKGMKCPWGKPDRHELMDIQKHPDTRAQFVEEVEDEFGQTKYKFFIPCEYEITKDKTPIDKAPMFFEQLRKARTNVLSATDWTQLADAPIQTQKRNWYREYRQYLRDLPTNYNNTSIHSWKIMSFNDWLVFKKYVV